MLQKSETSECRFYDVAYGKGMKGQSLRLIRTIKSSPMALRTGNFHNYIPDGLSTLQLMQAIKFVPHQRRKGHG